MSTRPVVVGLDLGTSSLKVVLVTDDHEVVAQSTVDYQLISGSPGRAEIDPERWREALVTGVQQALDQAPDSSVVGVGIDGQMHGLVAVDSHGDSLRPAMLWPDTRASAIAESWRRLPRERLKALANPVAPGMTGPMLVWLMTHEASIMARVAHVVQPKDWLRGQLTGWRPVTDPSDASATLLWNMDTAGWDRELCETVGLDVRLFAEVQPSDSIAGQVTPAAAAATGLPRGIPVSVGCTDVAATMLGMSFSDDRQAIIVGTGAQAIGPSADTSWPIRHHTYVSALGSNFAMGALMNAGLALGRVCDWLGASWEELYGAQAQADQRVEDASVPCFLPYLTGERDPLSVASGRGGFHHLGLQARRTDLLVAALEGVAFAIGAVLSALPTVSVPVVDLAGGGASEPAFQQLLADVIQRPVQQISSRNATAIGAALLGWAAAEGTTPATLPQQPGVLVKPRERPTLQSRRQTFQRLTEGLD